MPVGQFAYRARPRAGGWFPLCLAFLNAAVMLLWFWGSGRKKRFFDRMTLPMDSFLRLGDAGDTQMSMTVAQQRATVKRTGANIKRARGAALAPAETLTRHAANAACTAAG